MYISRKTLNEFPSFLLMIYNRIKYLYKSVLPIAYPYDHSAMQLMNKADILICMSALFSKELLQRISECYSIGAGISQNTTILTRISTGRKQLFIIICI